MDFMTPRNGDDYGHTLKSHNPDIIALQETHLMSEQEYSFCLHAPAYEFMFAHGSRSAGMLIAFKRNFGVQQRDLISSSPHHIVLDLSFKQQHFCVINVYALTDVTAWISFLSDTFFHT